MLTKALMSDVGTGRGLISQSLKDQSYADHLSHLGGGKINAGIVTKRRRT